MTIRCRSQLEAAWVLSVASTLVAVRLNRTTSRDPFLDAPEKRFDELINAHKTLNNKCWETSGLGIADLPLFEEDHWQDFCTQMSPNPLQQSFFKCTGNWHPRSIPVSGLMASNYMCVGENIRASAGNYEKGPLSSNGWHWEIGDLAISGNCNWIGGHKTLRQLFTTTISLHGVKDTKAAGGSIQPCSADEIIGGTTVFLGNMFRNSVNNNPYEAMHQPLMAFASLAILKRSLGEVRAWVPQTHYNHPIHAIAAKLFEFGGPAIHGGTGESKCFHHLVIPMAGEASILRRNQNTYNSEGLIDPDAEVCTDMDNILKNPDQGSPILRGYVDLMALSYGITRMPPDYHARANFRIVLADRLPAKKRNMLNSEAVTKALHDKGYQVDCFVPEQVSVKEQFQIFSNTDLLISAHGAGLAWLVMLPLCGEVLEYSVSNGKQSHYQNLALLAGRYYTAIEGPDSWAVSDFVANVTETVEVVQKLESYWKICVDGLKHAKSSPPSPDA